MYPHWQRHIQLGFITAGHPLSGNLPAAVISLLCTLCPHKEDVDALTNLTSANIRSFLKGNSAVTVHCAFYSTVFIINKQKVLVLGTLTAMKILSNLFLS